MVSKVIIPGKGRLPMLIEDWAKMIYQTQYLWVYEPVRGGWI